VIDCQFAAQSISVTSQYQHFASNVFRTVECFGCGIIVSLLHPTSSLLRPLRAFSNVAIFAFTFVSAE